MMRTIKHIHRAHYAPIGDLITYSPIPSATLRQIDPFLFLNHHGPQEYKPGNKGLPFGPHPHRGMETVTFILEGDIMHKDSAGHESIITTGGIQWMTAGSGLIHAETSSQAFKEHGGKLEILQLWLNLPARLKMISPKYIGLQKEDIPTLTLDEGRVVVNLIAGTWGETTGPITSATDVHLSTIDLKAAGEVSLAVPTNHNIFFYVIRGKLMINNQHTEARQLVEFSNDDEGLRIMAATDSVLLFGHAAPFNESVVAQGPFVMNTEQEIREAYHDYRMGKFGRWE